MQALRGRRSLPWRRVLLLSPAFLALALIGSALGVFFWLRGYQPLGQGSTWGSNPGDGVMVQPPEGSGGIRVFFPRYREKGTFRVTAGVANHGRFTVTVLGTAKPPHPIAANPLLVAAEVAPPKQPSYHGSPLDAAHPIRIQPGDEREIIFVYKFNWRCIGGQPTRYWTSPPNSTGVSGYRTVPLRIKYDRWSEKTQNVAMPFAITLVCKKSWSAPDF
jgi:hypothetical protein